MSTITLTFGERVENHAGMQMIGTMRDRGFTVQELKNMEEVFQSRGATTRYYDLTGLLPEQENLDEAGVLVVKEGVKFLIGNRTVDELYKEHKNLDYDKKALIRGRVVNRHACYNLCFADFDQEPDYECGKGRVISLEHLPVTSLVRQSLPEFCGEGARELYTESNYYYDTQKCGIGWHGDRERRIVIGIRLGNKMNLMYNWFYKTKPVGERLAIPMGHGDLYVMSAKAVGVDWMRSSQYTLRHSAGCPKFTNL